MKKLSILIVLSMISTNLLFPQVFWDGIFKYRIISSEKVALIDIKENDYYDIVIPEKAKYYFNDYKVSIIETRALTNGKDCRFWSLYDRIPGVKLAMNDTVNVYIPKYVDIIKSGILASDECVPYSESNYYNESKSDRNFIIPLNLNYIESGAFAKHPAYSYLTSKSYNNLENQYSKITTIKFYNDSVSITLSNNDRNLPVHEILSEDEIKLFSELLNSVVSITTTITSDIRNSIFPNSYYYIEHKNNTLKLDFSTFNKYCTQALLSINFQRSKILNNEFDFDKDRKLWYNLDCLSFNYNAILRNNITDFYNWHFQSQLKKQIFFKSVEFKRCDSTFQVLKKKFSNKTYYFEWKPAGISNYDVKNSCFWIDIIGGKIDNLSYSSGIGESEYMPYAKILYRPTNTFISMQGVPICLPSIPVKIKYYKDINRYGYINILNAESKFPIYITDKHVAMEMEENLENLLIYFVLPNNIRYGNNITDNVNYWDVSYKSKSYFYYISNSVRMLIVDKLTGKIYYNKLYNYTKPKNK